MKKQQITIFILTLTGLLVGCSSNDDSIEIIAPGTYKDGILVSNEGPFNNGSGTVSYVRNDLSAIEHNIFKKENDKDLGNIVQSIGFQGDNAYIVVNNSHKIEVVDRYTFKSVATIEEGLENPRSFTVSNGKGYVSNWGDPADEGDDFVAVIDLDNDTVVQSISVVLGPEAITASDGYVYVAHEGAFGQNNKVTVIDSSTDAVIKTLIVGDFPNSMYWDESGSLWVLSGGAPAYTGAETQGTLSKINVNDNSVEASFDFSETEHPSNLTGEGNVIYYSLNDDVYAFGLDANTLPSEAHISDVPFYTMAVKDGRLYGTDAKDFSSRGDLHVYELATQSLIVSLEVGLIPGGVYFN